MGAETITQEKVFSKYSSYFETEYAKSVNKYSALYETISSNKKTEFYNWMDSTPSLRELTEGQAMQVANFKDKEFLLKNKKFRLLLGISDDQILEGNWTQIKKKIDGMVEMAKRVPDDLFTSLLNGAFTTTICYDGKPLCDDNHESGILSFDNKTNAPLSAASLTAGIIAMKSFKSQHDEKSEAIEINYMPKLILGVPSALVPLAKRLVAKIAAATVDNVNDNEGAAEVLEISGLANDTQWFLFDVGSTTKPFVLQEQTKAKMVYSDLKHFETEEVHWKCSFDGTMGPTVPGKVYGSTGV